MDPRHADLLTDIVEESCTALAPSRRGQWIARIADNYEAAKRAAESAGTAKRAGTWYTPASVVASVLDASMPARPVAAFRACDPSCGTGNFLSAIATRLGDAGWSAARIAKSLEGMDLDPMAVAIARVRLRHQVGGTAAAWRAAGGRAQRSGATLLCAHVDFRAALAALPALSPLCEGAEAM